MALEAKASSDHLKSAGKSGFINGQHLLPFENTSERFPNSSILIFKSEEHMTHQTVLAINCD